MAIAAAQGSPAARLDGVLAGLPRPLVVAASGGVDSMTLAAFAHRRLPGLITVVHATSPAVPPEASARVHRHARREGWRLRLIDAGEFADADYLANPANRCFFCKTNLYGTIRARVAGTLISGTNTDDLGDLRPGLQAASTHDVRHPYVDAGIDKAAVRALARELALGDLAELPAAPCLSSRLETGIRVETPLLALVHRGERYLRRVLRPRTVRLRVRAEGLVVELDETTLARLDDGLRARLTGAIDRLARTRGGPRPLQFRPYRMGSAFLDRRQAAGP